MGQFFQVTSSHTNRSYNSLVTYKNALLAKRRKHLFRVSEVPPKGEVDASSGLLRMAGHGFDKHLQRALQQHVDAAVVIIIVTVRVEGTEH